MNVGKIRKKHNEAILDVEEYGVLSMTCSVKAANQFKNNKDITYTSKESYMWVPIIAYLVKETTIRASDIKVFLELSIDAITTHHRSKWGNRAEGLGTKLELINSMLFYSTRKKFENPIFYNPAEFSILIEDIIDRLERLGLMREQFNQSVTNNSYFNILGFVPAGLTIRTKLGEDVLTKLNSLIMFYAKKNIVADSDLDLHYKFYCTWQDFMQIVRNFGFSDYATKVKLKSK